MWCATRRCCVRRLTKAAGRFRSGLLVELLLLWGESSLAVSTVEARECRIDTQGSRGWADLGACLSARESVALNARGPDRFSFPDR